ncbi:phosphoserine phosphatase SerB [Kocuria palustris]|uniref:phosphoserine phosphatase SerB n=1 Tax=Kocuria palustris TaxID=71999 RepID=UPI0011A02359|nr:phosphoserine phosphatase SerB [Kocuria palustris]
MTEQLALIALARTPHPETVQQIMESIEEAGATIESHGRVRVTPNASGGGSSDAELNGYNAAYAQFTGLSLERAREIARPDPLSTPWDDLDVSVVPAAIMDPDQRKLLVMDADSTFLQQEAIDLLAARAGVQDQVAQLTDRAMSGEIDFASSLRERAALLEGLPDTVLGEVAQELRPTVGAGVLVDTFHRAEYTVGVVSGGFRQVIEPLMAKHEIDHYLANELEVVDGRLTGRVVGPIVDASVKASMLRSWAKDDGVSPEQTIAVGDGANDIQLLEAAAVGIAFNAKPVLRRAADAQVNIPNLDAVRFFADL